MPFSLPVKTTKRQLLLQELRQSGALGEDWAFGADGYEKPISDYAEALSAIAGSRGLKRPHAYGLDRFLDQAGSNQPAHCIVFAAAALRQSAESP